MLKKRRFLMIDNRKGEPYFRSDCIVCFRVEIVTFRRTTLFDDGLQPEVNKEG